MNKNESTTKIFESEYYQMELSKVLKAKRLEQGKSLEEVASGICSTSYLSRIENNLVKMQEPYMQLLFEKLSIDYEDLKKNRTNNYCLELLKKNLLRQKIEYCNLYDKLIDSNHYLDMEQQLIILYDCLLKYEFEKSELIMEKLDKLIYHFSIIEQQFYLYLIALYYYLTDNTIMSYRHIKKLLSQGIADEILYWTIYDLYLMILYKIGKYHYYVKEVSKFISGATGNFFVKDIIKHQYKILSVTSIDDLAGTLKLFDTFKETVIVNDDETEYFNKFYKAQSFVFNQEYLEALEILKELEVNKETTMLMLVVMLNIGKEEYNQNCFRVLVKDNEYDKFKLIKYLKEYINLRNINMGNNLRMQTLLKTKILNYLEEGYDDVIFMAVLKEILMMDIRNSKYKDACQVIFNKIFKRNTKMIDN